MAETLSDRDVLTEYWLRLDILTGKEWEDFYRIVRSALMRCPASELRSLPDSRESYIDEFFTEKLFFKAQRKSDAGIQSISGGALCRFFRNYLLDQVRHYGIRPLRAHTDRAMDAIARSTDRCRESFPYGLPSRFDLP